MEVIDKTHQVIVSPHPVVVDDQKNLILAFKQGESLFEILSRSVDNFEEREWVVTINGRRVPVEMWTKAFPKPGHIIEVRGNVGKQALYIIAMIALTYFTFGIGTAAGWGAGAAAGAFGGGVAGALFASAVFVAGSMIINKVLGPKAQDIRGSNPDSVYSIGASRNQKRPYEPFPYVIGRVKVLPDVISDAYSWYEGNDQYVGFVLTPGLNVHDVETLYIGDTPITNYEGVTLYYNGFSGRPDQDIPLYSNADFVDGATLPNTGAWVTRTTSIDTVRVMINLEYILGGQGTSGKSYTVSETIFVEYKPVGSQTWSQLITRRYSHQDFETLRATLSAELPRGQYDIRVRMLGEGNYEGKNTQRNDFNFTQLVSVQFDGADYDGIPRIGVKIRATDQLNGAPDTINCVAISKPVPVWDGFQWVTQTTGNIGANMLAHCRGITSRSGRKIIGIGLQDELINIENFKAFMLHCTANNYEYNYCVRGSRSHAEQLEVMALAGFADISWAGGKLAPIWTADGQPLNGVVNMATITDTQFQIDYTLANAADGVEYTYYDDVTWEPLTLRVPMPGNTGGILNPISISGEGVIKEAHAAELARFHLAQSLYQSKDITYTTDVEFLSYKRYDVLAVQHDLTQYGFGGRLVGGDYDFVLDARRNVKLQIDDMVRPPPSGVDSYVGVRIPGEDAYRVFTVKPFAYEMDVLYLVEAWPSDAPFPGESLENPPEDFLWIFDFKATPGLRSRVAAISPGDDFETAQISVVPEPPEYWTFIKTGVYNPPVRQSLLQTRPVASNLAVSEVQVVQGNTVYTELRAVFDISGDIGYTRVYSDLDGNGTLEEVASTRTRTASWRIPGAGTYAIVVRPFNPQGVPGIAVSTTYVTVNADAAPALVDNLLIEELTGGVRRYSWSFNDTTMQSPDFIGVQIRYLGGSVGDPNWVDMIPLGEGTHTATFESILPPAGAWTFAVRSVNTSGSLSSSMLVVNKTLTDSLGERVVKIIQDFSLNEQRLLETIEEVDQYSESVIQQAINISEINGRVVQNRSFISLLQDTAVTEDSAKTLIQQQVSAQTGDLRATVEQTFGAVTNLNGELSAYANTKVQTTIDGKKYLAGIGLGIDASGGVAQSEIAILADRFVFLNSTAGGNYYYPFEIVNGVVYANAAMIRDGTITNAKIGEEIKSVNYQWDGANGIYIGWRIGKDGTAQFGGDVEIRGNVSANSITGTFESAVAVDYSGNLATGVTSVFTLPPPLKVTESHRPELTLAIQLQTGDGQDATSCFITLQRENPNNPGEWWNITSREYAIFKFMNISTAFMFLDAWTNVANNFRFSITQGSGQDVRITRINGRIRGAR